MMILDTHVVSEPTKPRGDPALLVWLDAQPIESLYLTAVSLAEILTGLEILPRGKRRIQLEVELHALLDRLFGTRVLSFDHKAAKAYGPLVALARRQGQTVHTADAQIAAIAQVNGFSVVTRDQRPFQAMGVAFINPWST